MECEHPASYTARAVKKVLPERAMLTKDARQTLNTAATMFTLYLSSVAHDHSVSNKRQTVVLKDVLQALRDMDFEHFIGPIEDCLRDAKVTTALKKSKRGAEKPDAVAADANGEIALAADDDDEEMQSADDIATEEDDDDAVADEDDDEEDAAESEAADPQEALADAMEEDSAVDQTDSAEAPQSSD